MASRFVSNQAKPDGGNFRPISKGVGRSGLKCFNCGEPGHRQSECKKARKRHLFADLKEWEKDRAVDDEYVEPLVFDDDQYEEEIVSGDMRKNLMGQFIDYQVLNLYLATYPKKITLTGSVPDRVEFRGKECLFGAAEEGSSFGGCLFGAAETSILEWEIDKNGRPRFKGTSSSSDCLNCSLVFELRLLQAFDRRSPSAHQLHQKIISGPHDTQYYMENPEQAFFEYASSRTDEAGAKEIRHNSATSSQETRINDSQYGVSTFLHAS
nr:reverse transcriptase domain-containing protein [Tanacetum cinerariifolium]